MRTVVKGASLAALLLLAATGFAQDNKVKPAVGPADDKDEPGVHRMEIYNGPLRTVHYIYRGLSPSEAQAVRELERAENENILASDLLALRQQYASGERTFDAQRRFRQEQLYGYTSAESDAGAFTAYRRVGPFGALYSNYWGGWGWGLGGYGMSSSSASAAYSSADSVGLGQGVGDEGVLRTEVAKVVAGQATPEYAAKVNQDLLAATSRAASYPVVKDTLKLRAPEAIAGDVVITRVIDGKSEKIEGKVLREEGDWLILDTPQGKRRLAKTTIVDLLEKK